MHHFEIAALMVDNRTIIKNIYLYEISASARPISIILLFDDDETNEKTGACNIARHGERIKCVYVDA